jgi:transposase
MPKRISIADHLSLEELSVRYKKARCPVERSHYQIIWLLAGGKKTEEVSAITGYSRSWIYELVWGYNRVGPETLGDKRHDHPGAEPLLTTDQLLSLVEALRSQPPVGVRWNGVMVADWMRDVLGRSISRQRGWEYLRLGRELIRRGEIPKPKEGKRERERLGDRSVRPRRVKVATN